MGGIESMSTKQEETLTYEVEWECPSCNHVNCHLDVGYDLFECQGCLQVYHRNKIVLTKKKNENDT